MALKHYNYNPRNRITEEHLINCHTKMSHVPEFNMVMTTFEDTETVALFFNDENELNDYKVTLDHIIRHGPPEIKQEQSHSSDLVKKPSEEQPEKKTESQSTQTSMLDLAVLSNSKDFQGKSVMIFQESMHHTALTSLLLQARASKVSLSCEKPVRKVDVLICEPFDFLCNISKLIRLLEARKHLRPSS